MPGHPRATQSARHRVAATIGRRRDYISFVRDRADDQLGELLPLLERLTAYRARAHEPLEESFEDELAEAVGTRRAAIAHSAGARTHSVGDASLQSAQLLRIYWLVLRPRVLAPLASNKFMRIAC